MKKLEQKAKNLCCWKKCYSSTNDLKHYLLKLVLKNTFWNNQLMSWRQSLDFYSDVGLSWHWKSSSSMEETTV